MANSSKIPPRPTTISIPLKAEGKAVACPEIRRCQLEVVPNEYPNLLTVEDTGIKNHKLVSVGVFKNGGGCDVKVRVGLIAAGGHVAVGSYLLDEQRHVWETALGDCVENKLPLFANRPERLSQVRYKHNGELISLFHYSYTVSSPGEPDSNYMAVAVLRGGKLFVKSYPTGQSLQVYAALSFGFSNLYIAQSILPQGATSRSISYERYTWDAMSGDWSSGISGSVDCSAYAATQDVITVDRYGRIFAARDWTEEFVDIEESESSACSDIWPTGPLSMTWNKGTKRSGTFALWDINAGKFVSEEAANSHGMSISNGDYQIIRSEWNRDDSVEVYINGSVATSAGYGKIEYVRDQHQKAGLVAGNCTAGGVNVGSVASGYQLSYQLTYSSEKVIVLPVYITTTDFYHTGYTDEDGKKSVIDIGGWCFNHDFYTNYTLSGNNYHEAANGQNLPPCPPWSYDVMTYWQRIPAPVYRHRATWPVAISCYDVANAFYSLDNVSGDWYAGVLVNYQENGPFSWLVFKNGMNITASVASCVGNLFDTDFSAIYFR